jgi:3-isopropylmalate/(R)-2-methylmalate dehydratase large subunit
MGRVLADKLWDAHVVDRFDDGSDLLYVDLHLVHEVSSPQAFEGLRAADRAVRRPNLTLATMDHNVPTTDRSRPIEDPLAAAQMEALRRNCEAAGIPLFDLLSPYQGIVHMIGPELGLTQPGMTIVCGDSHTPTHGAFGALALGIGTSDLEHVLATQCLVHGRPPSASVELEGSLPLGISAKDIVLALIGQIGIAGGGGAILEFRGEALAEVSMEGRMTLCNMVSEAGARTGVIAPDDVTFDYLRGRSHVPAGELWKTAVTSWSRLSTDPDAAFDHVHPLDLAAVAPTVTWGTTPAMSVPIGGRVPTIDECEDPPLAARALDYMGLEGGEDIGELALDRVFIGSCTNGRLEDLRAAAAVIAGRRVASHVRAMVVPGSQLVKRAAEREGLDRVFRAAGFEWREPGCSMCLGMNPDVLAAGERCASTSNRNFEGRQGAGGRSHLVSPAMAAAAAIHGRFVDVRSEPLGLDPAGGLNA